MLVAVLVVATLLELHIQQEPAALVAVVMAAQAQEIQQAETQHPAKVAVAAREIM